MEQVGRFTAWGGIFGAVLFAFGNAAAMPVDPYAGLPLDQWVKVLNTDVTAPEGFYKQQHGASTYDSLRDRIVFFGADTHWSAGGLQVERSDNTLRYLDLKTLTWSHEYQPDDPLGTYTVNSSGVSVAGVNGDRPWAMHAFEGLEYDAANDRYIVSSAPLHPGLPASIPRPTAFPTWIWDPKSSAWSTVPLAPAMNINDIWARPTAYDSDREVVIWFGDSGVFELSLDTLVWTQVSAEPSPLLIEATAVYDPVNKVVIQWGRDKSDPRNDVFVYDPATQKYSQMATPGQRPDARDTVRPAVPATFHDGLGKAVIVMNDEGDSALSTHLTTWTYDAALDAWDYIDTADLPFRLPRNYTLEYVAQHDVMMLFTHGGDTAPDVWALRLSTPVPAPPTLALLGLGLVGLGLAARRRRAR